MAKPLLVMRLVNLTINFDIMLYLIESGIYAKSDIPPIIKH